MNGAERVELFIKALRQGYIYFRDRADKTKIHKGYIFRYEEDVAYFKRCLFVAYGVYYNFNHLVNGSYYASFEDCEEELIRNPQIHELYEESYSCGLITEEFQLDYANHGTKWALTKEELK